MHDYELEALRRQERYGAHPAQDDGSPANGWLAFCMILIFFTGLWNTFQGFLAFLKAAFFTGGPVFGSLAFWAIVWIAIGVLQIAVSVALVNESRWARWVAVGLVSINLVVNMLTIGIYPWWSVVGMGTGLLVLYGLLVQWRADPQSAG